VKKMLWIITGIVLAAALAAVLLMHQHAKNAAAGGVRRDNTDPDAPKQIASTELVSFSCAFSTKTMEPGTLDRGYYTFTAQLENGVVTGAYQSESAGARSGEFTADAAFMEELCTLVNECGLAEHNGLSYHVSGLPAKLGCSLQAVYASGEQISARNNQTNFLSSQQMEALESFFRMAAFPQSKGE